MFKQVLSAGRHMARLPIAQMAPRRAFSKGVVDVSAMMKAKGERPTGSIVEACKSSDTLKLALQKMAGNNFGSLVVTDAGKVVGIITERDFVRKLDRVTENGQIKSSALCSQIMTPDPAVVTPQDSLEKCISLMTKYGCRHLPVVAYADNQQKMKNVISMISIRDVVAQVYSLLSAQQGANKALSQLHVSTLLEKHGTSNLQSIREDKSMMEAVQIMQEQNVGSLVVMAGNQMTGIVTERDYLRKVIQNGKDANAVKVGEAMSHNPICVTPDYTFHQVAQLFVTKGFRHLPVMDFLGDAEDNDSRPMDMLSVKDLTAACISIRSELSN